ncbi:SurA N-terminal domain-containing protein [Riemerella columbina]|uniref:SurA N-terminal domain-containing protein n=1 Tax=Riemerella columbina TaxID=103810 RepID=UPI0003766B4C|nr:peptidylprolyl isomerase [Riemerella columbina]
MAILGEIRKRPWILIGGIAIALLAFLVNPDSLDKVFGKDPNILGKVNGEEITRDEFNEQLLIMRNQAEGQGQPTAGLEEQAWQTLVQSKLIKQQFEKMGLEMTDEFFWNQLQYDPMFAQDPNNFDAKGNFKANEIRKKIEGLRESGQAEQYNQWLNIKKTIEYRMMARQVFGSFTNGLTVNKKEVAELMKNRDQVADIDFVKIDYNEYAKKNPIKVTTQDLADFIKKHPVAFKSPATRNIGVVYFPAAPSAMDDSLALKELNKLYKDNAENFLNTQNDSMYVEINSESPVKYGYVSEQEVPQEAREFVKSAGANAVFGPYKSEGKYYVTKLKGKTEATLPKHILISYVGTDVAKQDPTIKRTKEQAKKLADSIATQVRANAANFNQYVNLSSDPGSAQQGGMLQWVLPGQSGFVKPFADWVENNPKGAVGVVETPFGYHVIVNENKMPVYKIANLAKDIRASKETQSKVYTQANTFIQNVQGKSFNDFANLAKKGGYQFYNPKTVGRFQGQIQGLGTDKDEEVLAWAFGKKTEKGETNIFTTSNGDYIVAYLNGKQDKGLADPESVREQIEMIVRNELLGKKIAEKIKSNASLDQVAKQFGTTKQSGQVNLLNPNIDMAMEPKVAGAAFGIKANKVSQPIEGNTGVYVLVKKKVVENKQPGDAAQITQMLEQQNKQQFSQSLMRSLEDNADIQDYRIEVYNKTQTQD